MNHTPHLANDLVYRSLIAKIEKLTLRVEALEGARRKPKRTPHHKAQRQQPERDAAAFAAMTPICQAIADRYRLDLLDLRGREVADPRFVARGEASLCRRGLLNPRHRPLLRRSRPHQRSPPDRSAQGQDQPTGAKSVIAAGHPKGSRPPIRFLSVCSGIEAASQALIPLGGFECAAVSEIEPHPCAVLAHRFGASRPVNMPDPDEAETPVERAARAAAIKAIGKIPSGNHITNYGDMSRFQEWPDAEYDGLFGGTPCQSFSVAGLRKGLADPRGNLMLTFGAIAARFRPRWVCWENVPGVLSSDGGRDFAGLLGLLTGREIVPPPEGWQNSGICPGIGDAYGIAWRVLDAQHVRTRRKRRAVPQRRRRVFVVGYLGDWRRAAAVLFDAESLRRDPPPRREAGQGVASTIASRPTGGGGLGTDFDLDGGLIADTSHLPDVCNALAARDSKQPRAEDNVGIIAVRHMAVAPTLRGEGFDATDDGTGKGMPIIPVAHPLTAGMAASANRMPHEQGALIPVCFDSKGSQVQTDETGATPTLRAMTHADSHQNGGGQPAVAYSIQAGAVRENPNTGPDGVGVQEGHAYTLEARAEVQAVAFDTTQITSPTNRSNPQPGDPCHTLAKGGHAPAVAYDMRGREGGAQLEGPHDTANLRAADGGSSRSYVAQPWAVRRLTPVECERLMGMEDDFTNIPWRGKAFSPDGNRYKELGNSWALNAIEWIGERMLIVDAWD